MSQVQNAWNAASPGLLGSIHGVWTEALLGAIYHPYLAYSKMRELCTCLGYERNVHLRRGVVLRRSLLDAWCASRPGCRLQTTEQEVSPELFKRIPGASNPTLPESQCSSVGTCIFQYYGPKFLIQLWYHVSQVGLYIYW